MQTLAAMFVAVLFANFITVWAAYAMWRIKRNEDDWRAIVMLLICISFAGLGWLALPA